MCVHVSMNTSLYRYRNGCVRACGFWVAHRNIHPHFQIPPRLRIFKRQKEHKKKKDSPFLRRRHRMGGRAIEVIIPGDGTNGDSRGGSGSDVQFRGGFASARGRDRPLLKVAENNCLFLYIYIFLLRYDDMTIWGHDDMTTCLLLLLPLLPPPPSTIFFFVPWRRWSRHFEHR